MLIDKNEHKKSLSDLWSRVFDDDYSFIKLIFNKEYDESILCFAEIIDGIAVSAFYLIENQLNFDGECFNGYYLYAAATLPEYRGKGIMSKLIRQAQEYCREKDIAYISLVPSQGSLYNYYSALGFCKAMHRYVNSETDSSSAFTEVTALDSPKQILDLRRGFKGNALNFTDKSFGYAFDCMKYYEAEFKITGDGVLLIAYDDDDSFNEVISADAEVADEFADKISLKGCLTSPFKLNSFKSSEAVPYGMLYPVNERLKRNWKFTDIYMNIALD